MATITHHAGRETRRPPIARRTLTVAALVAFLPGALFAAGVVTMGRWGVPLWPHQLWFWLLGASILGPLVAASIVRRWLWSSMFVLASLIALLTGGDLQLGLAHDMWDTCPGTNQPDGWERYSISLDVLLISVAFSNSLHFSVRDSPLSPLSLSLSFG